MRGFITKYNVQNPIKLRINKDFNKDITNHWVQLREITYSNSYLRIKPSQQ